MIDEGIYRPHRLIKDAAKHGELVVFVGAGASKLCGSPSWQEFANQVVNALEKSEKLSFLEAEQLRGLGEPRRTLSIAIDMAAEHGVSLNFDKILHPSSPNRDGLALYELLASLRPVFVTTNYDRWLSDEPSEMAVETGEGNESELSARPTKRPLYYLKEDLTPDKLAERGAVIHLHGSFVEPRSMVVSLRDYIEHYADARVQAFLSEMFRNFTVLFVGYGLAELEVLDHIIRANESLNSGKSEPRHFLLYAHRSTESVQTGFIERFFRNQCGVQVIRYCIDGKGYGELVEVFNAWKSQLDVREPTLLELQGQIDRYVSSESDIHRQAAIRLVAKQPELSSYFVNSLRSSNWFNDLDAAGFFGISHNPGVKEITDGDNVVYQADGWPALRYLEHIVESASSGQAKRIAEIVREISSDALARKLDNWRTWWSLAAILSRLPIDEVTQGDIEMCRQWLLGRFEANMVGQELGSQLLPRLLDSLSTDNHKKAVALVEVLSMLRPKEPE